MSLTGVTDKNGDEIKLGDFIIYDLDEADRFPGEVENNEVIEVVFREGAYRKHYLFMDWDPQAGPTPKITQKDSDLLQYLILKMPI